MITPRASCAKRLSQVGAPRVCAKRVHQECTLRGCAERVHQEGARVEKECVSVFAKIVDCKAPYSTLWRIFFWEHTQVRWTELIEHSFVCYTPSLR